MAAFFLTLMLIAGAAGPSACHDLHTTASRWSHLYSPKASNFLVPDLLPIVHSALKKVAQEALSSSPPVTPIQQCVTDLNTLARSQQEVKLIGNKTLHVPAIMLVLDAAGKPPAGLLQGAYAFRGNLEECQMIKADMNYSSEMYYGYLSLVLKKSSTGELAFPPLSEELCLPSSCDSSAVEQVFAKLNETVQPIGIHLDASSQYTSYSMKDPPITTEAAVMIGVCCVILLLVFTGTIVDCVNSKIIVAYRERSQEESELLVNSLQKHASYLPDTKRDEATETHRLLGGGTSQRAEKGKILTFFYEAITAFSLYKNIPTILATHQPAAAITSLNGLRVISMFWVIFCHTYLFFFFTFGSAEVTNNARNIVYLGYEVLPRYISQVIINGFLSVDSFFFLSGVLVSYLTLREMKRRKGKFPIVPYYLHRIIRLTPTYMFVLFFYWFFTMYLAQGTPSYQVNHGPNSTEWINCRKYWWTNLLYINNFYPQEFLSQCMGWSWYLANDFQFFVISPLIIYPLYVWFTGGVMASAALILVSFAVTGFIAGFYHLPASQFFPLAHGFPVLPDFPDYSTQVYIKPYCRIGPYIVGLVLGAIFFYNKKPSFSFFINSLIYLSLWVIAVVIAIPTVYGLQDGFYGHVFSQPENIIYTMLARTSWGVALALMIFACHHGYGGPIDSFLSMPFWVPLSRLTFNAYLVHPIILDVLDGSQRDTIYYTDITFVPYIIGSVVLSYGAAAVVSTLVEFPVANVEMAVFKLLGVQMRASGRRPKSINNDGSAAAIN